MLRRHGCGRGIAKASGVGNHVHTAAIPCGTRRRTQTSRSQARPDSPRTAQQTRCGWGPCADLGRNSQWSWVKYTLEAHPAHMEPGTGRGLDYEERAEEIRRAINAAAANATPELPAGRCSKAAPAFEIPELRFQAPPLRRGGLASRDPADPETITTTVEFVLSSATAHRHPLCARWAATGWTA